MFALLDELRDQDAAVVSPVWDQLAIRCGDSRGDHH